MARSWVLLWLLCILLPLFNDCKGAESTVTVPLNYAFETGLRCVGDQETKISDSEIPDLQECFSLCEARKDCFGINYAPSLNLCIPRTTGCTVEANDAFVMYQKMSVPKTTIRPQTASLLSNYVIVSGHLCTGGTSTIINYVPTNLDNCAMFCNKNSACYGFNWLNTEAGCILLTAGCDLGPDEHVTFYQKTGTPRISHLPTAAKRSAVDFGNFDLQQNVRCTGGQETRIGEALDDVKLCAKVCESQPDCFGFNWVAQVSICLPRRSGCVLEPDNASVFFRKIPLPPESTSLSTQKPTTTPATTTTQPASTTTNPGTGNRTGYEVEIGKNCRGGLVGDMNPEVNKCFSMCDTLVDCLAVVWLPSAGVCSVHTTECIANNDTFGAMFYRKMNATFQPRTTTTSSSPVPKYTSTTHFQKYTSKATNDALILSGYSVKKGVRCSGGTSQRIGDSGDSISTCGAICDRNASCYGFNWQTSDRTCLVRTGGCFEADDASSMFYLKNPLPDVSGTSPSSTVIATSTPRETTVISTTMVPVTTTPRSLSTTMESTRKPLETTLVSTTVAPVTTMTAPAVSSDVPGYTMKKEIRCSGGSSRRVGDNADTLEKCAAICNLNADCFGFNYQIHDRACVARTGGCLESSDFASTFYLKSTKNTEFQVKTTSLPLESTTTAPQSTNKQTTSPIKTTAGSSVLSGYSIKSLTRCSGGSSRRIGDFGDSIEKCSTICDLNADCYGINWQANERVCVVRSTGCLEAPDAATAFYMKLPPSSQMRISTTVAPPESTTVAPTTAKILATTIEQSLLQGYLVKTGVRCAGGTSVRIGEVGESILKCSALCDLNTDCYGFNWQANDRGCIARTFGCVETVDAGTIFYMKQQMGELFEKPTSLPSSTLASTTMAPNTTAQPPTTTGPTLSPVYEIKIGVRCSGGTSQRIGDFYDAIPKCSAFCDLTADCYGFNYQINDRACVARTSGCVEVSDAQLVFYLKTSQTPPTSITTPTQKFVETLVMSTSFLETTIASKPGYSIKNGIRCSGGSSQRIGETSDSIQKCSSICDLNAECFGFNWQVADRVCVARTAGCIEVNDTFSEFHQKEIRSSQTTMKKAPSTTSGTLRLQGSSGFKVPTTVQPDIDVTLTEIWGFELKNGTSCASPRILVIVMSFGQLDFCVKECTNLPLCVGFDVGVQGGMCYLRGGECKEQPSDAYAFYHLNPGVSFTAPMPVDPTAGFVAENRTRCAGGSSATITTGYSMGQCSSLCLAREDCIGYNWLEKEGWCAARTFGCLQSNDSGGVFYRKLQSTTTTSTSTTTTSVTPSTSSTKTVQVSRGFPLQFLVGKATVAPTLASIRLAGFEFIPNAKCTSWSPLATITISGTLLSCSQACLANQNCVGFDVDLGTSICLLRSSDCNEERDVPSFSYYRRLFVTSTEPTSTQQPSTSSGYSVEPNLRCAGGSSYTIATGTGLEQCTSACNSQADCIGVNFERSNKRCIARSLGCFNVQDGNVDFYRKSEQQQDPIVTTTTKTTTPTSTKPTPSSTTTKAPFPNVQGFELTKGSRCSGFFNQRELYSQPNIQSCVTECLRDPNCAYFDATSYVASYDCFLRSSDCVVEENVYSALYRRIPASTTSSTVKATNPASSGQIEGFTLEQGKRCSGGTSMVVIDGVPIDQCIAQCNAREDCFGINLAQTDLRCVARTSGCVEMMDSDFLFYRKVPRATTTLRRLAILSSTTKIQLTTQKPLLPRSTAGSSPFMQGLANFRVSAATRCVGGSSSQIGEISFRVDQCANFCNDQEDCFGFNWERDSGSCVPLTSGCKEEYEAGSIFYRKQPTSVTRPTTKLPSAPPSTKQAIPEENESGWENSILLPNFMVRMGQTCVGDASTQIGDVQTHARTCGSMCEARNDCYGFTWFPKNGTCVVRTLDCVISNDDMLVLLYRKLQSQPTTTNQATTEASLAGNFLAKEDTRCAGGQSIAIGGANGLNACMALCSDKPSCYGFNFVTQTGDCALRSATCVDQRSSGMTFYVRVNH